MRIGSENSFVVVGDPVGPRFLRDGEYRTLSDIFPHIAYDFLYHALTYHGLEALVEALLANTMVALPPREGPAPIPPIEVEQDEGDVEHVEFPPAEVYEGYKRIFAEDAAHADGISVFFVVKRSLAVLDQLHVTFLSKIFTKCPLGIIRKSLIKFDNHAAPAFASLFVIQNRLNVRDCGGWLLSGVDRRLNKVHRASYTTSVLDAVPASMRREIELIMGMGRIGAWFECEVCCEERSEKSFLQCSPTNESTGGTAHRFCHECIRGLGQQLADGSALLRDCAGIPCMDPACDRIFSWPTARKIVPKDLRRRLDERMQEANLLAAGIRGLERCLACNLAVEMGVPKEVDKVFTCVQCGAQHCRLCERKWDGAHFGRRCEEVGDFVLHQYEAKMTEAVTRKCGDCGLVFVKSDGCNMMRCRCGMTSCYLCKASRVTYEHFCRHAREPGQKCGYAQCTQKCTLWFDVNAEMNKDLERIKGEALRYDARIAERLSPVPPKRMKIQVVHVE